MPTESITRIMARMSSDLCRLGPRGRQGSSRYATVAADHPAAKIGELHGIEGWTGVVRGDAAMFRRKTKCQGDPKFRQRIHLLVEPLNCAGPETVGPGQPGPEMLDAEPAHPA